MNENRFTKEVWLKEKEFYNFKHVVSKISDEIQSVLYFNSFLGFSYGIWTKGNIVFDTISDEKYSQYLASCFGYIYSKSDIDVTISTFFHQETAREKENEYIELLVSHRPEDIEEVVTRILAVFFDYTKENFTDRMIITKNNSCAAIREFLFTKEAIFYFEKRGFALEFYSVGDFFLLR